MHASMKKNKAAHGRFTPTLQQMRDKPTAARMQKTNENLMVVGMQQKDVSPMVVGAQWTGVNTRAGTVHPHHLNPIMTQKMGVNSRIIDIQRMDVNLKAENTTHPYPQDPREIQHMGNNLRVGIQQTSVHLRAINIWRTNGNLWASIQWMGINRRVIDMQWMDVNLRAICA